jgi:choline kinase
MDSITTYFDINDITTVVGFKKNLIMEQFPEVNYVYNPFFDTTNTSKSLLRALKKHRGNSILWFNGDVVFDPQLVSLLQNEMNNNQSFVSVNTQSVSDEEVKYTLKDGFVESLSKEVKNGLGEAVGINFIAAKDLDVFINQLENCDDNDYFEKGLEMAIAINQLQLKVVDISAYNCIEVDFKEDLLNANKII